MQKTISVLLIIALFIGFAVFDFKRKETSKVLEIITANQITVDLNNNGKVDIGETVCIPDTEVFTSDISHFDENLSKKYNISFQDAVKIGYLTDGFADNALNGKRIKLKLTGKSDHNCQYADILINKNSYRKKLVKSGFAIVDGKISEGFEKQFENARRLNLVILNHKSDKYHKIDCKYGLVAHDAVIIPFKQLPKTSKPCKFCHVDNTHKEKPLPQNQNYPKIISNGSIKMFLTDLTSKLKPDGSCSTEVCKEVLSQINSSEISIDMAIYGWDSVPDIYNALLSAKKRGVQIRIVHDNSKNSYYPETSKLIELADKKSGDGINFLMHNKFIILDGKRVVTGSMNFSRTGFSGFNTNCIFLINSEAVAKIYAQEFEQMLDGKFHNAKSKVLHNTVNLGESSVTPFFSPKDKIVTTQIIPLINGAKNYVYIPAFILTHDGLANALINAKKRGVDVKVILDATNTGAVRSKIRALRKAGVPVKVENYAGKIHSKSVIIDDRYIFAGSMNFTNSGENKNDENSILIEDVRLAKFYRGFFNYLWEKIPEKYLTHYVKAEGKEAIGSCSDGIDNDYDGKIDLSDDGCR